MVNDEDEEEEDNDDEEEASDDDVKAEASAQNCTERNGASYTLGAVSLVLQRSGQMPLAGARARARARAGGGGGHGGHDGRAVSALV